MTSEQKAIIKKLGGVPKVKGSAMYRKFYGPKQYKKEVLEGRAEILKHKIPQGKVNPVDYQKKFGRANND